MSIVLLNQTGSELRYLKKKTPSGIIQSAVATDDVRTRALPSGTLKHKQMKIICVKMFSA